MEKWGLKFGKMVPKIKTKDLLKSWKIVKGDMVEVISGAYKGKQGKVLRVQRERNGLIVEGVNLVRILINNSEFNSIIYSYFIFNYLIYFIQIIIHLINNLG